MISLGLLNALLSAGLLLAASLVLPALAWAACRLLQGRAALRHLVWLSTFAILLALPLLMLLVPPQLILERAVSAPLTFEAPAMPVEAAPEPFWTVTNLILALATVWAAGLFGNLLGLGAGIHGLHRLRRISTPFQAGADCDVRLADTVPLTFGWLKPVILLPLDAPGWPRERLDAVLGHERAHVARRDNLSHLLAFLACAFYWPNPFLWLARDAMRADAEIAADDCVLASGMKPSAYAAELVELTAEYHGHAPFAASAMASQSSLETRVTSVLSPTLSRKGVTGMDVLRIACLGSAAALMLAFARPGIAEAQAPAPPPAALPMPVIPEAKPLPLEPLSAPPVIAVPPVPPAPVHARGFEHAPLTAEEKIRIEVAVAKAKTVAAEVKIAVANLRPEIERAVTEAKAHKAAAEEMKQKLPQIRAEVNIAIANLGPQIEHAIAEAKAGHAAAEAVKQELPRIRAEIEKARRHMEAAIASEQEKLQAQ